MKIYKAFVQRNGLGAVVAILAYRMKNSHIDNFLIEDDRGASGGYRVTVVSDRVVADLPINIADPWEVALIDNGGGA